VKILVISTVLFCLGAYGAATRRNTINLLMCLEVMFNAAILNLVYFARSGPAPLASAQVFAALAIAVVAAETAVGLALALAVYRRLGTVEPDALDVLGG
jgi:NADH-quinone oxidoreductase subunit K